MTTDQLKWSPWRLERTVVWPSKPDARGKRMDYRTPLLSRGSGFACYEEVPLGLAPEYPTEHEAIVAMMLYECGQPRKYVIESRLIISPESVWAQRLEWERLTVDRAKLLKDDGLDHVVGDAHTVIITCDLFAGDDGLEVVDDKGQRLWLYPPDDPGGEWVAEGPCEEEMFLENGWRPVTITNLRNRALSIVEKCPHLEFKATAEKSLVLQHGSDKKAVRAGMPTPPAMFPANLTLTQQEEPSRG